MDLFAIITDLHGAVLAVPFRIDDAIGVHFHVAA
jgi:hypothetical protein